jgi:periplasmic divalent cation tolerance protein
MEKICLVYVTASGKEEAEKIGEELLSRRLAACVNIFENVVSFYRWEGKEENAEESVLVLKTKETLLDELEKAVKELHSYSCPSILAVPVIHAGKEYAGWISAETK